MFCVRQCWCEAHRGSKKQVYGLPRRIAVRRIIVSNRLLPNWFGRTRRNCKTRFWSPRKWGWGRPGPRDDLICLDGTSPNTEKRSKIWARRCSTFIRQGKRSCKKLKFYDTQLPIWCCKSWNSWDPYPKRKTREDVIRQDNGRPQNETWYSLEEREIQNRRRAALKEKKRQVENARRDWKSPS